MREACSLCVIAEEVHNSKVIFNPNINIIKFTANEEHRPPSCPLSVVDKFKRFMEI